MSVRFIESGIRKGIALVLVGTMAGGISYGQAANVNMGRSDFLNGYYYNEDIKKMREELMSSIERGGKAKTYEKKRDLCPKTINK